MRVAHRFDDWLRATDPAGFERLLAAHDRHAGFVVDACGTGGTAAARFRITGRLCHAVLLLAGLAAASASHAGGLPVADIGVRFEIVPSGPLRSGSTKTIHVLLTNHGPGPAPSTLALFDYFLFGGPGSQVSIYPIAETAPCAYFELDLSPGRQAGAIWIYLYFPAIAPGEEARCSLSIAPIDGATGTYTLGTQLFPVFLDSSAAYIDPNPGNDRAAATIVLPAPLPNVQPVIIPSMSGGALLFLSALVALVGLLVGRRAPNDAS